jgi:hypothetical protein
MCWISDEKTIEYHVSNGMYVYKVMTPLTSGISSMSQFERFIYKRNKLNEPVEIKASKFVGEYPAVRKGYHSWSYKPKVFSLDPEEIYLMYIPKGTIYAKNKWDEIVSENIVMIDRLTYKQEDKIPIWHKIINKVYDVLDKQKNRWR